MALKEIMEHRRAVRIFDPNQQIDANIVRNCLEVAQLAPTSSNMQLWEAYHITDMSKYPDLLEACLGQSAISTAQQCVVFVTRPDLYKERAQANLDFELENVHRHSSSDRQEARIKLLSNYYGKLIPFLYSRAYGLMTLIRVPFVQLGGLFRPVPRQVSVSAYDAILHKSCMLVAQTFMIGMAEAGYDTCPLEGVDTLRVKRALGLPSSCKVSLVVPCGIRAETGVRGDRFRIPFADQYHQI